MSKLGKEGQNGHFLNCLSDTKDKTQIVLVFFKIKDQKKKIGEATGGCSGRLK